MSRRKHKAMLTEIVPGEQFTDSEAEDLPKEPVRIEFIKNVGVRELNDQQADNVLRHTIRTRFNTRIKPGMAFVFNGRQINIRGPIVNVEEKSRWILVPCEELS